MASLQEPNGLVQEYTEWLAASLARYETLAKSLVKHRAEKGRIVESVVKGALRSILPGKYSLGTGFIVTSTGQQSPQLDIVIYDGLTNTPVILEGGTGLFPIECVYGSVEVKTTLNSEAIDASTRSIQIVRSLAAAKRYAGYLIRDDGKGNKVAVDVDLPPESPPLPPRSFVFAVDSTYANIANEESKLKEATERDSAHVHALAVLRKDWLIRQQPFEKDHRFTCGEGRSFAMFCATVLSTIQSISIQPAAMNRYLGLV